MLFCCKFICVTFIFLLRLHFRKFTDLCCLNSYVIIKRKFTEANIAIPHNDILITSGSDATVHVVKFIIVVLEIDCTDIVVSGIIFYLLLELLHMP